MPRVDLFPLDRTETHYSVTLVIESLTLSLHISIWSIGTVILLGGSNHVQIRPHQMLSAILVMRLWRAPTVFPLDGRPRVRQSVQTDDGNTAAGGKRWSAYTPRTLRGSITDRSMAPLPSNLVSRPCQCDCRIC